MYNCKEINNQTAIELLMTFSSIHKKMNKMKDGVPINITRSQLKD